MHFYTWNFEYTTFVALVAWAKVLQLIEVTRLNQPPFFSSAVEPSTYLHAYV